MNGSSGEIRDGNGVRPMAVVVGLCAHGLAVVRSLARAGIEVVALEDDDSLPGTATRAARVEMAGTTKGDGLVATLKSLADRLDTASPPVLFLTNDRMVRTVGEHWNELRGRYRLLWSERRHEVLRLIDKRHLESHCRQSGLAYPKTVVFDGSNCTEIGETLGAYPVLVKPSQPMGTFKAVSVEDETGLRKLTEAHRDSLPFLVQQLIPGGDETLRVAVFMMNHGRILGTFEGRKLKSQPPCRGQTSVMQWKTDERVRAAGEQFFAGLGMSGPLSVEFKEAPDGTLYVIEPTLGRTDYFVDACVSNGCDLPVLEYAAATALEISGRARPLVPRIWCDTERDPACFWRTVAKVDRTGIPWFPVFPYLSVWDPLPFFKACRRYMRALRTRCSARILRSAVGA